MKKTFDINQMKTALSKITKQIYNSNWMPEIILSVNRGGCVPGIYLSHEINIPHKLYGIISVTDSFSVGIWRNLAISEIKACLTLYFS